MSAEVKTVNCDDFARFMGLGPRKFRDALRAGTIPMPLNPAAQKIEQYRWATGTVNAFLTGAYKGPLMPGDEVDGPRKSAKAEVTEPAKRGRPKKVKNVEAVGVSDEGREPIVKDLFETKTEESTQFVVTKHTDGTMTWSPIRLKS
jgi:hypothetical protein